MAKTSTTRTRRKTSKEARPSGLAGCHPLLQAEVRRLLETNPLRSTVEIVSETEAVVR